MMESVSVVFQRPKFIYVILRERLLRSSDITFTLANKRTNECSWGIILWKAKLTEIDAKMEALTDALIDRLFDKETYSRRRETLLLEKACIAEDIKKTHNILAAPEDVRQFLELMKNVTELYESLKPAEKRTLVEIVSSNRLVRGKKLELEPSKWLEPVLHCAAASYCAPSRPETRTGFGVSYAQIQGLVEASTGEISELLASLMKNELP